MNNGDLVRKCDFIEERQWVKNWRIRGRIPANLRTPENMKQLAVALEWSGVQLYIAMGYDMYDSEDVSPDELALIKRKRALPPREQKHVMKFWENTVELFEMTDEEQWNVIDSTLPE